MRFGELAAVPAAGADRLPARLDYIVSHELALSASRGKRPTCFQIATTCSRGRA